MKKNSFFDYKNKKSILKKGKLWGSIYSIMTFSSYEDVLFELSVNSTFIL